MNRDSITSKVLGRGGMGVWGKGGETFLKKGFLSPPPIIPQKLCEIRIQSGAAVGEHDLDVIRSADYIVDMGPGGGKEGGQIVASGTLEEIKANEKSVTGKYL